MIRCFTKVQEAMKKQRENPRNPLSKKRKFFDTIKKELFHTIKKRRANFEKYPSCDIIILQLQDNS